MNRDGNILVTSARNTDIGIESLAGFVNRSFILSEILIPDSYVKTQVKERMSRIRETIDAYDTYISEDYKTLDSYARVLRRFGIEYDMSGLENSNN